MMMKHEAGRCKCGYVVSYFQKGFRLFVTDPKLLFSDRRTPRRRHAPVATATVTSVINTDEGGVYPLSYGEMTSEDNSRSGD